MSNWYRELADWLMENGGPKGSWMYAASLHFEVTEKFIAQMWHSDAFRDHWARRLQAGEKPRKFTPGGQF
jgi:hypothetical protein